MTQCPTLLGPESSTAWVFEELRNEPLRAQDMIVFTSRVIASDQSPQEKNVENYFSFYKIINLVDR